MPPKDLPQFVDWVIEQKPELRETDPAVKRELHDQLLERVEQLVNMALLANLPKEVMPEFEQLLDGGTQEEIEKFVETKVPNLQEVIAKVLVDFQEQYLGLSSE